MRPVHVVFDHIIRARTRTYCRSDKIYSPSAGFHWAVSSLGWSRADVTQCRQCCVLFISMSLSQSRHQVAGIAERARTHLQSISARLTVSSVCSGRIDFRRRQTDGNLHNYLIAPIKQNRRVVFCADDAKRSSRRSYR